MFCGKTNRRGKMSKFAELLNAENHSKKGEKRKKKRYI
tara:strand:- start:247 stop:360 length:114 start_codon:yes stop_codon:yes gene_type:complete